MFDRLIRDLLESQRQHYCLDLFFGSPLDLPGGAVCGLLLGRANGGPFASALGFLFGSELGGTASGAARAGVGSVWIDLAAPPEFLGVGVIVRSGLSTSCRCGGV